MLSKKIRSIPKDQLVFDPDRKAPDKPPPLWTFRKKSGWTAKSPICKCPVCDGTGFHAEDIASEHDVMCDTCQGKGKISEGELSKIYFDLHAQYRVDFVEWMRYKSILTKIKRKLDKREKVFLGLTGQ